ncbi:MAG TPA: Gfo/Idh/MocA family oxidoreductase, partial [Fimbriimonadaceae bacterium]|nr:Gfo/Idh/MocA family oxidoreductase [Fimbriimonadaceae bacterium]
KSTGLLLQKGAHDIDVLHYLCDGFSKRVSAMGGLTVYGNIHSRQEPGEAPNVAFNKTWPPRSLERLNPVVDVEDLSMMNMELDNGVFASYQQCHYTPDAWRNYTIIGDEGRLENFGDAPGKAVVRLWDHARYAYEPQGDLEYRVPEVGGWHGGSDDLMVAEFLRYVAEGGPCTTSPLAGRMAVAAGIIATESIRSGGAAMDVPTVQ